MSKMVSEVAFSSSIIEPQGTSIKCLGCKSREILFDPVMGEQVCGKCGIVFAEKLESLEDGLDNTLGTVQNFSNSGLPSSLTHYDKGLSTIIPYSTIDGNGSALNSEQRGNMQRMIRWNKISYSNRSHHRNLKNAFSVLLRIRDKLSLSQPVVEKAAYYYRKTLDLNLLKGRSISGFVVACVYIACRGWNGEINGRNIQINRYGSYIPREMLPVFVKTIGNQNPSDRFSTSFVSHS